MSAKRSTITRKGNVVRMPLSRDSVVAAARDMIIENGHEALSLRPLARRLGVTAAAIYAYVDDKHDLLRTVAEQQYDQMTEAYLAIATDEPLEKLREIGRTYVAHAMANPELFHLMFLFPPVLGGGADEGDVVGRQAFNIASDAVEQAMAEGKLAGDDAIELSLAIWAAVHGVAVFCLTNASVAGSSEANKMIDVVLTGLLKGLAPDSQPDC